MKTRNLLLLAVLFLTMQACGPEEKSAKDVKSVAEGDKYSLSAVPESPTYDNAIIEDYAYIDGEFKYIIPEGEYQLGQQTEDAEIKMCANSAKGQHIHQIIDNEPYTAHYNSEFRKEIPTGEHYILSFLSRSYHESIKDELAAQAHKVFVDHNAFVVKETIEHPMLFYSRPKGTYVGEDSKKVMLDYYTVNAPEDTYSVRAEINGEVYNLERWEPLFIEGLPMGENTITLSLLDSDGELVDTPLNPVSRTIQLVENPEG